MGNVEDELEAIGDNMKQLEISAEKAQEREDKLLDKIHTLLERLKVAEARFEYGEMNVSKLNLRIDDIEDEIFREKLKIIKVSLILKLVWIIFVKIRQEVVKPISVCSIKNY